MDGGLHDKDDTYTWYEPDSSKNNGFAGYPRMSDYKGGYITIVDNSCYGYAKGKASTYCNTHAYVKRVNAKGWCGANDWRMPTPAELQSIVDLSRRMPAIDTGYFPNTAKFYTRSDYWSGIPNATQDTRYWLARAVEFASGRSGVAFSARNSYVLLVRDGQ